MGAKLRCPEISWNADDDDDDDDDDDENTLKVSCYPIGNSGWTKLTKAHQLGKSGLDYYFPLSRTCPNEQPFGQSSPPISNSPVLLPLAISGAIEVT